MSEISEAVILMAGSGSRLQDSRGGLIKPLVSILGRPLISYTFAALQRAGIRRVYAVVGFESKTVSEKIGPLAPSGLELRFIENRDWQKQNGISVLAAASHVTAPFVLTMSDHLFDQSILDRLIELGTPDQLNLAIDRKVDSIFDSDDAMKVQTRGERIVTLGKDLENYDAIDTGVFVCGAEILDHLGHAKIEGNGDCSLADGVRSMAKEGKAHALDIGDSWWQDVDTPEMFAQAEKYLRARADVANHV